MIAPALPSLRLAKLNFVCDVRKLTRGFTGRDWLFDEIGRWVQHDNQRFFILTGEPGIGKSAIAARLTRIRRDVAAYHFCVPGRSETVVPGTILRSLAAQLGDHLPDYGAALANTVDPIHLSIDVRQEIKTMTGGRAVGVVVEHLQPAEPAEELEILFRAPLAELEDPLHSLLIVLDSLDEALTFSERTKSTENLVTLLAGAEGLPPWLRFFCTTRPEARVLRYFGSVKPYQLRAESESHMADVHMYIRGRVADNRLQQRLQAAGLKPQTLIDRLEKLPIANFLYTSVLLGDITDGRQSLEDLAALPKTIDEIYHRFLLRLAPRWEDCYQLLLRVLVAALQPLAEYQIAAFAKVSDAAAHMGLGVLQQFLNANHADQKEVTYQLFHPSLRDYLTNVERNPYFWCAPKDGHRDIASYYLKPERSGWSTCDVYGLKHLPSHLAGSGQVEQLRALLVDYSWLQAKLDNQETGLSAAIADYALLPGEMPLQRGGARAAPGGPRTSSR